MGLLRNILHITIHKKIHYPSISARIKDLLSNIHFFKKKTLKERILEKLTFRTWLFLLLSLFIITIGIYFLTRFIIGASANWYNDNWQYRQKVPITNSGSHLSNYQISFNVDTATLISAGKMQSDCDDIRIVDSKNNKLAHILDTGPSGCNTSSTNVWTKVTGIPSGDSYIYIYYGNSTVSNNEDGDNVFDAWNLTGFTETDPNSHITVNSSRQITTDNLSSNEDAYVYKVISSRSTGTIDLDVVRTTGDNKITCIGVSSEINDCLDSATGAFMIWRWGGYFRGLNSIDNSFTNQFAAMTQDGATEYYLTVKYDGTNATFYAYSDPARTTLIGSDSFAFSSSFTHLYATNTYEDGTAATIDDTIRNFHLRSYAATEPTIGTLGPEEATRAGPVAYWKLDEGQGTSVQDFSSNNLDGTFGTGNSAPSWVSEEHCISGKCLSFDGSWDVVDIPDNVALDVNKHTLSAWVWLSSKNNSNYVVFSKWNGAGNRSYFFTVNPTTKLLQYSLTTNGSTQTDLTGVTAVSVNEWHYITATYDGSTMKTYVDGKLDAQRSFSGTVYSGPSKLTLGHNNDPAAGAAQFFTGYMDEPKIYNYARTEAQIKSDYVVGAANAGSSAILGVDDQSFLSEGLVGYWKMDEVGVSGSNWTAIDSSGNRNNGTGSGNASVGTTVPGKFGNAGYFDGDADYVLLNSEIDLGSEHTICTWANPSASDIGAVVAQESNTEYALKFYSVGSIYYRVDGSPYSFAYTIDGQQHFFCQVRNKDTLETYRDGILINSQTGLGSKTLSIDRIGRDSISTAFNGTIDELRLYNRPLETYEIQALYNWSPGPSGYWKMDDNAGTTVTDSSGNSLNGSLGTGSSSPKWSSGKLGSSLYFDGDSDHFSVTDSTNSPIDFTNQMSMMAWIKSDKDNSSNFSIFIEKGEPDEYEFYLRPVSGGHLAVEIGNSICDGVQVIETGKWYHAAATWDGATVRIYVNGILDASCARTYTMTPDNENLVIGYNPDSGADDWIGQIDDIKLYSYPRSQAQIIQDMNGGHPAPGSPVGSALLHYRLDEGYGTTVNNAGNLGSTLNGTFGSGDSAPTWTNDGKFSKAVSFDGTGDYVRIEHNDALNFSTADDFTVAAWFRSPTGTVVNSGGAIVEKWIAPGGYPYALRMSTGGVVYAARYNGTTSVSVTATGTYNDNIWHHMVFTKVGTNLYLYMDGKLSSTGTDVTGTTTNTNPLFIGSRGAAVNSNFKGQVDEVKIYSFPLTADQVKVEYNQGKALVLGAGSTGVGGTTPSNSASREYCVPGDASTCNAPYAEWLFNEGSGTTVYDTSGNGRNGTFGTGNSAPTWRSGKNGSGIFFDGTGDFVNTATEVSFSSSTSYTASAWLKPYNLSGGRYVTDRTTATNELISFGSSDSSLFIQIRGDNGAGIVNYTVPSVFTVGEWTFFTMVRDVVNDVYALYVNGQYRAQTTDTTTGTNSPIIRIGNHSGAAAGWFGIIDELKFYDYARTPAQIAWEYNQGAPVAWYRMDEGTGSTVYNAAKNANGQAAGNNGTLTIGASGSQTSTTQAWTNGTSGKFNKSLSFDGTDDYVSIPYFAPSSDFSITAWIKRSSSLSSENEIFSWGGEQVGTDHYQGFRVYQNKLQYGEYDGTWSPVAGNTTIGTGEFYHAAITMNGTTTTIYLNGKVDGTGTVNESPSLNGLSIGAVDQDVLFGYFHGQIDDVRYYNYPLTPAQIKTVMNEGAVTFK